MSKDGRKILIADDGSSNALTFKPFFEDTKFHVDELYEPSWSISNYTTNNINFFN